MASSPTLSRAGAEKAESKEAKVEDKKREEEEECVWREARLAVGGWLRVGLMPRLNLFFHLLQLTEY